MWMKIRNESSIRVLSIHLLVGILFVILLLLLFHSTSFNVIVCFCCAFIYVLSSFAWAVNDWAKWPRCQHAYSIVYRLFRVSSSSSLILIVKTNWSISVDVDADTHSKWWVTHLHETLIVSYRLKFMTAYQ